MVAHARPRRRRVLSILASIVMAASASAAPVAIHIDPSRELGRLSPHLTAACIEDVNHEIYGGLYSQMIFGESFQEPPRQPIDGWPSFGGVWSVSEHGTLQAAAGQGPKLLRENAVSSAGGSFGVEIRLPEVRGENAGVVFGVANPGNGADRFDGYEISLDANSRTVRLARHRQNYELTRDVPLDTVTPGRWITLLVTRVGRQLEISIDGTVLLRHDEPADRVQTGTGVGFRTWNRPAEYRNAWSDDGHTGRVPFTFKQDRSDQTSGMWRKFARGGAA